MIPCGRRFTIKTILSPTAMIDPRRCQHFFEKDIYGVLANVEPESSPAALRSDGHTSDLSSSRHIINKINNNTKPETSWWELNIMYRKILYSIDIEWGVRFRTVQASSTITDTLYNGFSSITDFWLKPLARQGVLVRFSTLYNRLLAITDPDLFWVEYVIVNIAFSRLNTFATPLFRKVFTKKEHRKATDALLEQRSAHQCPCKSAVTNLLPIDVFLWLSETNTLHTLIIIFW